MNNPKTWHPQPRIYKKSPHTTESKDAPQTEGESVPRRNVISKEKLSTRPVEDVATVYDIFRKSAQKYGNAKAMGYRKVVRTHDEFKKITKMVDGKEQEQEKKWTYFELSEYHYMSFAEYERIALQCGAGLRKLGLEAGDRLHIFAATSPFWLAMAHGANSQSLPIVTAYDTLGEEGLRHSLIQTKAKAIFLDPHLLSNLVKPLKEAKNIQHVIYNSEGSVKQEDIDKLKAAHPNLTVRSFNELTSLGESNPVDVVPPEPEDLCCIMYTSGSTGAPKGVLIKHSNVIAAISGVDPIVGKYLGPGDGMLAYLPLAHILEFMFENACMYWGGTLGYGSFRTVSDTSVRGCKGDIREFKPTVMVGVPAVWELVKKGILTKVNASNFIVRNMFWSAMTAKTILNSTGVPGVGVLDSVVFSKVKDATGGRLRICMNGGGPIAKDTQRFISTVIAPMINGYGLTETCGMGALMDPAAWTDESLGEVPASVEVKLVDFPDAGYYAKNKPPQGEIWIRGKAVVSGYLDLEKENKEAFTEDGWFKTGDIGEWDWRGDLKVIDRKKNLVKTLSGEYIALEKLESIYRSTPVVANICVYAAENKNKPIAIIVPAEKALEALASQNGIKSRGLEALSGNSKLQSIVLKELQTAGRGGGLGGIEIVEGVVLADEEWTPQNDLVTSAQKLNRKNILAKYKKQVEEAYNKAS